LNFISHKIPFSAMEIQWFSYSVNDFLFAVHSLTPFCIIFCLLFLAAWFSIAVWSAEAFLSWMDSISSFHFLISSSFFPILLDLHVLCTIWHVPCSIVLLDIYHHNRTHQDSNGTSLLIIQNSNTNFASDFWHLFSMISYIVHIMDVCGL
jgi:hypothetical protein